MYNKGQCLKFKINLMCFASIFNLIFMETFICEGNMTVFFAGKMFSSLSVVKRQIVESWQMHPALEGRMEAI